MTSPRTVAIDNLPQDSAAGGIVRRAFSFPVFLGALLVAGVFFVVRLNLQSVASEPSGSAHTSIIEGDTWWHITTGERILQTHTWPTQESDSFTANGDEWIAYEWLGEVAMALAARLGGLRGLAALLVGLAGTILVLVYYSAYLRTGSAEAAFLACVVMLPLAAVSFSLRPQLFGYVFFLVTLICLERFRLGRQRHLWLLPAVFLLWINTHPTFLYGFLLLLLYWASGLWSFSVGGLSAARWTHAERHHLALVSLLCVLTLPLNPYGTRLLGYLLKAAFFQPVNLANIQEWRSLPFDESYGKLFLVMLLVFLFALLVLRPKYRLEEIGLLLFAIGTASLHLRFLILFAVIFAPFLTGFLAGWIPPRDTAKDHHFVNAALVVAIAASLLGSFPSRRDLERVIASAFPVGAIGYLRQHPLNVPMFNEYLWGAYLTRSLGPQHKVFIDGRADAYEPAGVLGDYVRIVALDGEAMSLLSKYGVGAVLIQPGEPLATVLAASGDWQQVYIDNLSVLFVRTKQNRPKAQPWPLSKQ